MSTTHVESPHRIGQLNGKWAVLLKTLLISYPAVLSLITIWGTWVTVNEFQDIAIRDEIATKSELKQMKADILAEVARVSLTDEWKGEIRTLRVKAEGTIERLARIEALLQERAPR